MSDEREYEDGVDQATRTAARAEMAAAAASFADSYEFAANGAIVTAFVTIIEVTIDARRQYVVWGTGDGTITTDDDTGWIAEHRIRGLVSQCLHDIDRGNVRRS